MVKENKYLWLRCLVAFALQFLAFVYKPFVIVELVYLISLIILDKPENKICYLLFMLPFYNVFRYSAGAFRFNNIFDSLKTLYLSTILVLVFCLVMGVHFVLDIKNSKKSINLKSIIVLAILYILFLVPFNSIDSQAFSSILVISSLFLATYLIYQYKECFNLRKILDIWLIGVVLSVVTYLFKDILPYLGDYIVQFEQRFSGLQRDPNYFGFELMVLLVGYTILFFKQQLKYEALIPFGIISIIAIFTLSKSFLISYVLYLAVRLVYLLRYILKQIKDKKKKLTFICLIITGVVICSVVAIIVLPKLFEGRANVVDTKSGGVYNFINSLTTGRLGIWIDYIKLYFKSFLRVVFGYGSLNGYPMDAIHNTPLQILFFGGIIAFGILIYALIKFIKNHKCPAIFYILMGILLIHSCSVDLLFSYRTYLILAITMLCFEHNNTKITNTKEEDVKSVNEGAPRNNTQSKIAIFSVNMCIGGVEKSLIEFLKVLDKNGYEVDLFLMNKDGALLNDIPQNVNIKEISELKRFAPIKVNKALKFNFLRKVLKFGYDLLGMQSRIINSIENSAYKQDYEIAIVYQGLNVFLPEFVIKKISAKHKYAFVHIDFSKNKSYHNINKYLKKFDKLVTVTKSCEKPIVDYLKVEKEKVTNIYNLIDANQIIEKGLNTQLPIDNNVMSFVSVSRLAKEKAYIRTLKALKKLKDKGYKFKYTIVGSGFLENKIDRFIAKNQMQEYVQRVEQTNNPYPYIKQADCLLLLSYQESAGLVLFESFVLGVPVITTNTISAKEIVGNKGIVCENSQEGIEDAIEKVLQNPQILQYYKNKLEDYEFDKQEIEKQIINLIDLK